MKNCSASFLAEKFVSSFKDHYNILPPDTIKNSVASLIKNFKLNTSISTEDVVVSISKLIYHFLKVPFPEKYEFVSYYDNEHDLVDTIWNFLEHNLRIKFGIQDKNENLIGSEGWRTAEGTCQVNGLPTRERYISVRDNHNPDDWDNISYEDRFNKW